MFWLTTAMQAVYQRYRWFVSDRAVGTDIVVVLTPFLHFHTGVVKAHEPMCVQAFLAELLPLKLSINALSVGFPGREKSRMTPF